MKYSIIAIGDELLIGQVTDTNSGWIARHLTALGWETSTVQVVADDSAQIVRAIDIAMQQTDVVLMTGGLGPTKDDITKSTLCDYFGGSLIYNDEVAQNIKQVMAKRHLQLNEYTQMQAMVPSSCRIIENEVGTAPIMWFERNNKVLVSLPGVPFEMQTMMERAVIPELLKHFNNNDHIVHRTLMVSGLIESALAMRLDDFERHLPKHIHLAYLPQPGLVRLRLTGISTDAHQLNQDIHQLTQQLHNLLGEAILCDDDLPLSAILGNILRDKKMTLATAESCTGGNIAHQITSIPGSSDYFVGSVVCYSNEVKAHLLGVSEDDLARHGAVSEPVVRQMSIGACRVMGTDCAIATSGIAGPGGGSEQKPVGTVWMSARCGERLVTSVKQYPGDRSRVIERATTDAQLLLINLIRNQLPQD